MSNSSLVNVAVISPFKNSPRSHVIDKITIHHMAGNLTAQRCGELFQKPGRNGSANYGIGSDGTVGLYVDEADRAWTSGSAENDNRAITIEVANDGGAPDWHVSAIAYAKLLDLVEDICRRNGIERLNFTGDASGNLTMHKYFQATACPGPYLASKFPEIAAVVNSRLAPTGGRKVKTLYKVYAGGKWLPEVRDREDYAGNFGQPISGVIASTDAGRLIYRVGVLGGKWLPEVMSGGDYAGNLGQPIDRIMVKSENGGVVHVQAHCNGKWLPSVTGYDKNDHIHGYAGNPGHAIDAIYIWADPIPLPKEDPPADGILRGDANGDGKVTSADIVRLKNHLANIDYDTGKSTVEIAPGADVNGDGKITSADIVRLKKDLANKVYPEEG